MDLCSEKELLDWCILQTATTYSHATCFMTYAGNFPLGQWGAGLYSESACKGNKEADGGSSYKVGYLLDRQERGSATLKAYVLHHKQTLSLVWGGTLARQHIHVSQQHIIAWGSPLLV